MPTVTRDAPPERRGGVRATGRAAGELLVTAGAVVLLFAAYLVVGTGWAAARDQDAAAAELERRWSGGAVAEPAQPAVGAPVLVLEVPRLGRAFTVLEGVGADVLARGPGRYPGAPDPGVPGNLAIAGHRVTRGAPFDAVDALRPCDPLVLRTRDDWWVYRVLPCGPPLPADYADVPGLRVVGPGDGTVLAPVPGRPGAPPTASLLTLTTCHPRFSAQQRLVAHAVLVRSQPVRDGRPAELGGA